MVASEAPSGFRLAAAQPDAMFGTLKPRCPSIPQTPLPRAIMKMCALEQARNWLNHADAVAVLTGAGISAESGIPTFRGTTGLWKQFRPEDLATPAAFARDPELVWQWYDWRRGLIARAKPNAGHVALAQLQRQIPRFTLITQNVD